MVTKAKDTKESKKGGKAAAKKMLTVTQLRSTIGFDDKQELAMRGLGLRRIRHTVQVEDTPSVRGLILKVRHLVKVEGA